LIEELISVPATFWVPRIPCYVTVENLTSPKSQLYKAIFPPENEGGG